MKGPHRALLLVAIVILAAVCLVVEPWKGEPPDGVPSASENAGELATEGPDPDLAGFSGSQLREELASESPVVDAESEPIVLRVLEKADRTPVPDAELRVSYDLTLEEAPDLIKRQGSTTVTKSFRSDAAGVVRLSTPRRYTWMEGFRGELYGWGRFLFGDPEPERGWILLLEPDQGFDLVAVDPVGEPVPGIPTYVSYRSFRPSSGSISPFRLLGVPGADGALSVRHVQTWDVLEEEGRRPVHLTLHIVAEQDPTATVDLNALPREPMEMICPGTGSLRIRVLDPFGHTWEQGYVEHNPLYGVHVTPLSPGSAETEDRLDDVEKTGPGEFLANVALGQSFEVTASQWTARVAGPTRLGEEVDVTLRPSPDSVILSGVLAGESSPLAETGMWIVVETEPDEHSGPAGLARTAEDGTFWFVLDPELRGVHLAHLDLDLRGDPTSPHNGVTRVPYGEELRAGIHDLGTIRVVPPPLVVAGRFIHGEGSRTLGMPLTVQRLRQRTTGEVEWIDVPGLVRTSGPGTFELRGEVPAGPLRIIAGGNGFVRTDPIEFAAGTTDLEIPLEITGSIELPVLHDPLVAPNDFTLRIELTGENGERPEINGAVQQAGDTDRVILLRRIPAGRYRLEVSTRFEKNLLAGVDGIEVRGGAVTGIEALDLRGRLTSAWIRVVDESGADLRGTVLARGSQGSPWQVVSTVNSTQQLLLGAQAVDLLVWARGHRFVHVPSVRGDTTVTLRPALQVTVVPDLPVPVAEQLQVGVELHASDQLRQRIPGLDPASDTASDFASHLLTHRARDIEDEASFQLPLPGRFEVRVTLRRNGRSARLSGLEPGFIDVLESDGVQRFGVRIPEKSLQDALAALDR